jgi:hypothetical protein
MGRPIGGIFLKIFQKTLDKFSQVWYTIDVDEGAANLPSGSAANPLTRDKSSGRDGEQSRNTQAGERSLTQGSCESGGNRETPHQSTAIKQQRAERLERYRKPLIFCFADFQFFPFLVNFGNRNFLKNFQETP